MIARKLDSDSRVTTRLVDRAIRKASATVTPTRSPHIVSNYRYGTGGGRFGQGGQTLTNAGLSAEAYTPSNPGSTSDVLCRRIVGRQGAYLQYGENDDSVRIVADVVNDPMFWLMS